MSDLDLQSTSTLNNGVEIPCLGLGTFLCCGRRAETAVRIALEVGYRHIDTAAFYGNEREIGVAVRASGVPREEVFVTTKLWNSDHGFDNALGAFEESLGRLNLGYIDLYLIHWPEEGLRLQSWGAFEKVFDQGKCKSIGVSNYMIHHLEELLAQSRVVPAVNQVEFSPFLYQQDLLCYCRDHGIALEAYSPLTKGQKLREPFLGALAEKYGRTPAQILIRWALQHDLVVIPKSSSPERIRENADVFGFEISADDMGALNALDEDLHVSWDPTDAP